MNELGSAKIILNVGIDQLRTEAYITQKWESTAIETKRHL